MREIGSGKPYRSPGQVRKEAAELYRFRSFVDLSFK